MGVFACRCSCDFGGRS